MFLTFLLACAPAPAPVADAASSLAPPAPWYYVDVSGTAIDPQSLHLVGREVVFRTVGDGLRSGALDAARAVADLACPGVREATRLVVTFEGGRLSDTATVPANPCVEGAAWARAGELAALHTDAGRVGDAARSVLVLDVPGAGVAS